LHIIMAKLWGLVQKNKLFADGTGLCTIMLSELLPLRVGSKEEVLVAWDRSGFAPFHGILF